VGSGFMTSLAHPGGNVTGFMHFEPAMGAKWLEVLKAIVPTTARALVLYLPEAAANLEFVRSAQAAQGTYGVVVSSAGIHKAEDIEKAIAEFAQEPNGGLIILPNPISGTHRALIAETAIRHRLPSIAVFRNMTVSGVLACYGIEVSNLYRRAAEYTDRLLRGEKAKDLPVQLPTRYELIVNMKTATALGLEIPPCCWHALTKSSSDVSANFAASKKHLGHAAEQDVPDSLEMRAARLDLLRQRVHVAE